MTERSKSTMRKTTLADETPPDVSKLSPSERVELVWQLTKTSWAFKDPTFRESRLRRDIGRIIRRRR